MDFRPRALVMDFLLRRLDLACSDQCESLPFRCSFRWSNMPWMPEPACHKLILSAQPSCTCCWTMPLGSHRSMSLRLARPLWICVVLPSHLWLLRQQHLCLEPLQVPPIRTFWDLLPPKLNILKTLDNNMSLLASSRGRRSTKLGVIAAMSTGHWRRKTTPSDLARRLVVAWSNFVTTFERCSVALLLLLRLLNLWPWRRILVLKMTSLLSSTLDAMLHAMAATGTTSLWKQLAVLRSLWATVLVPRWKALVAICELAARDSLKFVLNWAAEVLQEALCLLWSSWTLKLHFCSALSLSVNLVSRLTSPTTLSTAPPSRASWSWFNVMAFLPSDWFQATLVWNAQSMKWRWPGFPRLHDQWAWLWRTRSSTRSTTTWPRTWHWGQPWWGWMEWRWTWTHTWGPSGCRWAQDDHSHQRSEEAALPDHQRGQGQGQPSLELSAIDQGPEPTALNFASRMPHLPAGDFCRCSPPFIFGHRDWSFCFAACWMLRTMASTWRTSTIETSSINRSSVMIPTASACLQPADHGLLGNTSTSPRTLTSRWSCMKPAVNGDLWSNGWLSWSENVWHEDVKWSSSSRGLPRCGIFFQCNALYKMLHAMQRQVNTLKLCVVISACLVWKMLSTTCPTRNQLASRQHQLVSRSSLVSDALVIININNLKVPIELTELNNGPWTFARPWSLDFCVILSSAWPNWPFQLKRWLKKTHGQFGHDSWCLRLGTSWTWTTPHWWDRVERRRRSPRTRWCSSWRWCCEEARMDEASLLPACGRQKASSDDWPCEHFSYGKNVACCKSFSRSHPPTSTLQMRSLPSEQKASASTCCQATQSICFQLWSDSWRFWMSRCTWQSL